MNSLKDLNDFSSTGVFYEDQNNPIITRVGNEDQITSYAQEYLSNRYTVNGLIDTNRNVMSNLTNIANSAGSWISYDILDGKWSVVINKAGTSEYSFSDDNIIGSIKLNGSGLDKLYNAVEVQFPHTDLQNQSDYTRIDMLPQDMLPNEQNKTLKITYPLVDNPIQAELLGFIEFKQSRVDQIVTFRVDYSYIGITAGTVIDISSDIYGWTNKEFRIIKLSEVDDTSGINIEITALEYDASVYDESNLTKYQRSNSDGIIQIGALGKPGTPEVYRFNVDTRPGIYIESVVPNNLDPTSDGGIVEGMQFFTYFMPDSELPNWEVIDDETRKYTIASTILPPSGKVFEPGYTAYLDIDNISSGNVLVKTRAINGITTGPYSDRSGLVEFLPVQVTNAIDENTDSIDSSTGQLAMLAGLFALLNNVDGLFQGNTSQTFMEAIYSMFTRDGTNSESTFVNSLKLSPSVEQQGFLLKDKGSGNFLLDFGGKQVPGPDSPGGITAGSASINWTFNTGKDLDIRCFIQSPVSLQPSTIDDVLGWTGEVSTSIWPPAPANPIIQWGGDNRGLGEESVLVYIDNFIADYPSERYLVIECRGNWFVEVGTTPVILDGEVWQGGTPVHVEYGFDNPTAEVARPIAGLDVYVMSLSQDETALGDLMGTFIYDTLTGTSQILSNTSDWQELITTPPTFDSIEPTVTGFGISHLPNSLDNDFKQGELVKAQVNTTGPDSEVYFTFEDPNNFYKVDVVNGFGWIEFNIPYTIGSFYIDVSLFLEPPTGQDPDWGGSTPVQYNIT